MTIKTLLCPVCKKEFTKYVKPEIKISFCSKECHWEYKRGKPLTEIHRKNLVSRKGSKVSIETKLKMSNSHKQRFLNNPHLLKERSLQTKQRYLDNPELRIISGNINRGKSLTNEHRTKIGKSNSGKTRTKDCKEKMKNLAKERYTKDPSLKEKIRSTNEAIGRYKSLKELTSIEIFYREANWVRRMFELIEDKTSSSKLSDLGVFNPKKNTKGVVRDHIYPRKLGYIKGVFPEILRHPCNCKLISNIENITKKDHTILDESNQSLEELFSKIETYSKDWFEQKVVLELINKYRLGERWIDKYKEIK